MVGDGVVWVVWLGFVAQRATSANKKKREWGKARTRLRVLLVLRLRRGLAGRLLLCPPHSL